MSQGFYNINLNVKENLINVLLHKVDHQSHIILPEQNCFSSIINSWQALCFKQEPSGANLTAATLQQSNCSIKTF
jgi:hypothetical protein